MLCLFDKWGFLIYEIRRQPNSITFYLMSVFCHRTWQRGTQKYNIDKDICWNHSGFVLDQWEKALLSKASPRWLSPYQQWSLLLQLARMFNASFFYFLLQFGPRINGCMLVELYKRSKGIPVFFFTFDSLDAFLPVTQFTCSFCRFLLHNIQDDVIL